MSDLSIQDLQIKQMYLERHIEEQDRVIYKMQNELDSLKKQLAKLLERVSSPSSESGDLPANEKPPHY